MSMTPEQESAVKARGEVLVSASAGAGKTTVMIKRLADILEEGASLDNVLAVTFTKKAAAQMKDKLRKELIARLDTDDEKKRENIRLQLSKINSADISTIHSFCARLVRTYFYVLKVDASFEVLSDGAEQSALRARALDDLFDGLYKSHDKDFELLLGKLRKKRSDKTLKELVCSSYDEVRQRPRWQRLLSRAERDTFTDEGFERVRGAYALSLAEKYSVLIDAIDAFKAKFKPSVNAAGYFKVLDEMRETLINVIAEGDPFNLPQRLCVSAKPRVKAETAEEDAAFSAFSDGVKKKYRAITKDLEDEQTERARFLESGVVANAFSRLVKLFAEAYDGVKRDEGKLDYADLEHCALALLTGDECDNDVKEGIREKYKYVFVDEYQDVNPIQDEIISAVAGGGDIFCVGDLKQAIYGFRGSRSRFFSERCGQVSGRGRYIILPDNFRSGAGVIGFVNRLFSEIMKPPLCEFDYSEGHAMRGGAMYNGNRGRAEICLFDGGEKVKKEAEGVYSVADGRAAERQFSAEGLAVLSLVEEALKSEYFDADSGEFKKVQAGDICVLTRKRANKSAREIVRALSSKYPVAGAAETNICDRPEIRRMLDILSYIENGEQDVPLVCALLSPLGCLTESELAAVRIFGGTEKNAPAFGKCCKRYAEEKRDALSDKLRAFFARADKLRLLSESCGAARLIDEIMRVTGFSAAFDTEQKVIALRRLQREAASPSGELYLSAFLSKIRAGGYNVTASSALSSDCVKVMTMHASKGLEFPVVIVADIAVGFGGDERAEMPFGDDFGFAPRYFGEGRIYRNTILRRLYSARKKREDLSNEINLFYVACTRAKYALHVLCGRAEAYDGLNANFAENYADLFDVSAFTPRILPVERVTGQISEGVKRVLDASRADVNLYENLKEIAEFKYPYKLGVELPVKSSASQLLSLLSGENADLLFDDGAESGADTSIEAGIAYHRFLELCNFEITDKNGIISQLGAFASSGVLAESQRARLDPEQLESILKMPAFNAVRGRAVYREREFVCRLPSADYLAIKGGGEGLNVCSEDGNGVILQGAIDLLCVRRESGRVVAADIIDYKYTAHGDGYLAQKYKPQLALYRSVVCKIYALPESAVSATIVNIRACRQIKLF
ncbi:MAG: UvrD-helicase domain-containing protein [Roseburia sp.]|nr:UvrD-helicase domain-containing protein [Roseburia sp.]